MTLPYTQSEYLSILTQASADAVCQQAELALVHLGHIQVLNNRSGLVMLPYSDSAGGVTFHLGEVLVSEAHIQLENGIQGYGLVIGRDLVQAMAVAVLDAALQSSIALDQIVPYLQAWHADQKAAEAALLAQVEATRVEMETF